jgi:hypothetical protein
MGIVQPIGDAVRGRDEMLRELLAKMSALSLACPAIVSTVASLVDSSTQNWT